MKVLFYSFFELALKELYLEKAKNAAKIITYALILSVFSSLLFFQTAVETEDQSIHPFRADLYVQKKIGTRTAPLSDSLRLFIQNQRGILGVRSKIWGMEADESTSALFTVMATEEYFKEGENSIQEFQPGLDQVFIGKGIAELKGYEVGDYVSLKMSDGEKKYFTVKEILPTEAAFYTRDVLLVHPRIARKYVGYAEDQVTDFEVYLRNSSTSVEVARKLSDLDLGLRLFSKKDLQATFLSVVKFRGTLWLYGGGFALLSLLLQLFFAYSSSTDSQAKKIAVLRATGWTPSHILTFLLIKEGWFAFTATGIGMLLGYIHIFLAKSFLIRNLLMGWSTLIPEYSWNSSIQFSDCFLLIFLGVFPYLSAIFIPSYSLAVTEPASALRS